MSSAKALAGKLTPEVIKEAIPWTQVEKLVVIFQNQFGDMVCLVSDEAQNGYFIDLAELQVMNQRVFKALASGDGYE